MARHRQSSWDRKTTARRRKTVRVDVEAAEKRRSEARFIESGVRVGDWLEAFREARQEMEAR